LTKIRKGEIVAKGLSTKKEYDFSADELFIHCYNSLETAGFNIRKKNIAIGEIKAAKTNLWATVIIETKITPLSEEKSEFVIRGYVANSFRENNIQRNMIQSRLDEFWPVFDEVLKRAKIQYG